MLPGIASNTLKKACFSRLLPSHTILPLATTIAARSAVRIRVTKLEGMDELTAFYYPPGELLLFAESRGRLEGGL